MTDFEINGIPVCGQISTAIPDDLKKEFKVELQDDEFIAGFKRVTNSQNGKTVGIGLIVYQKVTPKA